MKSMLGIFHIAVVRFILFIIAVLNNDNNINVISISEGKFPYFIST